MNNIVTIANLSKVYPLYSRKLDLIKELAMPWKKFHSEHLALDDISINITRGEHLGIIGRNGSGKSTLLKIICGVVTPTVGEVKTSGTVGALLELGAGFNAQLSGRANIEFMTTLSGIDKSERKSLIKDIIDFADIGPYIDQPVRTYSSGMFVRLAFAQSVMTSPDLLIVDEALSVGDIYFQQKCIRKMEEYRTKGTVIFVSHDMSLMSKICSKVLWLDKGKIKEVGDPKTVCEHFLGEAHRAPEIIDHQRDDFLFEPAIDRYKNFDSTGSGKAKILNSNLSTNLEATRSHFMGGERCSLDIIIASPVYIKDIVVGFTIKNRMGLLVFGSNSEDENHHLEIHASEKICFTFEFTMPFLQSGEYTVSLALAEGTCASHVQLHVIYDALNFTFTRDKDRDVIFYNPITKTNSSSLDSI